MAAIESQVKELVRKHPSFNAEKETLLNPEERIRLEYDFKQLIKHQLLSLGPYAAHLSKNYRPLSLYIHPDRINKFSAEMLWVNHQLSLANGNGGCFVCLGKIYNELKSQNNYIEAALKKLVS